MKDEPGGKIIENNKMRHKMRRIQAKTHELGTHEINKRLLSVFDDKRSVSNDGIHMQAYFHKKKFS